MAIELATPRDIEIILGRPLSAAEQPYIDERIAYVSQLIRAQYPDIDERMMLDPSDPRWVSEAVVKGVIARVVGRALNNPGGASSMSETTGPSSYTVAYRDGSGRIATGLYLDADDLALLAPPAVESGGAFTVPIRLGPTMSAMWGVRR